MKESGTDIERLIVRQLDGELSDDEQLELNRELVRNPEARRMMEAYERIDELAAAALNQALTQDRPAFDPSALTSRRAPTSGRRYHRGWWLVPGAIAAALLAVAVARFPLGAPTDRSVAGRDPHRSTPVVRVGDGSQNLMRNAGYPARERINRHTGREVIGVLGEDGNIYWIEVERIQTIKRPRSRIEF